ncbi:MAG: thiamine diphosphokinase [candidate division Zixibacteria bacterium]|nr:thiamine diphosphokinase [candidate division Zixibacteria bacterium]
MLKSKKYLLLLNNRYPRKNNSYFLKKLKGATTVAVDGGVRFFIKNKIYPDIIIGDFDSSPALSNKYLSHMEVISFPRIKDKTDSQLALEMALGRGATEIEILGGVSATEIDHTIGNIFLLELVNKFSRKNHRRISARILGPDYEITLLENGSARFQGRRGEFVSIIPISETVRVKYSGLDYPPPEGPLWFGESLPLRNQFTGGNCRIIARGKVIIAVIHRKTADRRQFLDKK